MTLAVGIDLGGTKVAGALVDPLGACGRMLTAPTPARQGPAAVLDCAAAMIQRLRATAEEPVIAVGVGAAGVIEPVTGRVLSATDHLPGWAGTDIVGELEARLGVPVVAQNDVHAHAAGEAWIGAGSAASAMLVVAVGTGVGGALVLDGVVRTGAHSVAGHVGHVPSPEAEGQPCACGGTGHVEAVASGPGLHALYQRLGGRSRAADARAVVDRATHGDDVAREAVRVAATALGRMMGGLANVLDPDVVIVTGGLSGAGETWWRHLRAGVDRELVPSLVGLPVVPGSLGPRAGIVGAARHALTARVVT